MDVYDEVDRRENDAGELQLFPPLHFSLSVLYKVEISDIFPIWKPERKHLLNRLLTQTLKNKAG